MNAITEKPSTLQQEITRLNDELRPATPEEIGDMMAWLVKCGFCFPESLDPANAKSAYRFALEGQPKAAISRLAQKLARGKIEKFTTFLPTPAQMAKLVDGEVGHYRDRLRTMREDAARAAETETPKAAPFGKVWGAWRMALLLAGPTVTVEAEDFRAKIRAAFDVLGRTSLSAAQRYVTARGIGIGEDGTLVFPEDFEIRERQRRQAAYGFPEVNRLHEAAEKRKFLAADMRWRALGDCMEPVPVGSDMWKAWEAWHSAQNMPFVPDPENQRVVFFPKGGPEAIASFEAALRDIGNAGAAA
ncbi:hypothetical protein [Martelella mangrovi]|uniref:Uncharacterized protein n=1 Tax=Martelella mangrovi TaxID=1397477 RepID=A0ABV2IIH7_9HYPH